MGKVIAMAGMVVLMLAGVGEAVDTCCPPVVTCPDVKVECKCPDTKDCPTLEAVCQCDCGKVELPGLWRLTVGGRTGCGVITVIGGGFLLDQGGERPDFFLINILKKAKSVESCE